MKTEQINRIVSALKEKGFGWVSDEALRKITLLVWSELVTDAAFEPLSEEGSETSSADQH